MGFFGGLGRALGTIGKYYTTPEGLQTLGAGLKDMSSGGSENMMAMQQMALQRQMLARKQAAQQQIMGLFGGQAAQQQPQPAPEQAMPSVADMVAGQMAGDPSAPSLAQVTARPQPQVPQMQQGGGMPSLSDPRVQQVLLEAQQNGENISPIIEMLRAGQPPKPAEPRYIEGPNGIYEISPGQPPKMVQGYPERPNTTPGQIDPKTGRWTWAPGYLEGQGALTGARRDAVVARPMPQRGRAGGGKSYKNDDVTWN